MLSLRSYLPALLLAVLIPLLSIMREQPLDLSAPIDTSYNIVELSAPALSGPSLTLFAYIAARSPLSHFILRKLLNNNGIVNVRNLAAKMPHLAPTHHPAHRVSDAQMRLFEGESEASRRTLHAGISAPPRTKPYYSTMDYHRTYASGRSTPTAVMERVLAGCEALKHLVIFSSLLPDDVRRQAAASDARWAAGAPLSVFDGVPVAVKDMIAVAGHPLCHGSNFCSVPGEDDLLVRRLRAAGAIILGLTVMTEGGVTPMGYNALVDGPFNPYDVDFFPGGSSSGSAVAVASGLVPLAVGFDGGGSIRVPAAMSGILGLATTYGRVSYNASGSFTNVKVGPMAATLVDLALGHMLFGEVEDASVFLTTAREIPPPILSDIAVIGGEAAPDLGGVRLGVYWDHFRDTEPGVYEACLEAVRELESQGAILVEISIPNLRELHFSHTIKILSEFGLIWEKHFYTSGVKMEANTEMTIAAGRVLSAAEVLSAERLRTYGLVEVCEKLFRDQQLDAIVSPTLGLSVPKPMPGSRGYGESNSPLVGKTMRFMPLANFLGIPALSVPVGFENDTGLPIGLQLLGDAWMEHKLIRIASGLEGVKSSRKQPPPENFWDVFDGL